MAFVLSPESVLIFSAMCDMYLDFASLMAIAFSLMQSLSSLVVCDGSGLVVDRCVARSLVMRSMRGCILSLLISNQSAVGLFVAMAVDFAVSSIVSLNVVYSSFCDALVSYSSDSLSLKSRLVSGSCRIRVQSVHPPLMLLVPVCFFLIDPMLMVMQVAVWSV